MWRHFGAGVEYVENDIPWDLFIIRLAVAMDLDERDRHFRYVLAGGDPKKWRWTTPDRAGTRGSGSQRTFWDNASSSWRDRRMRGKMEHIGPERLDVKRVVAAYEKDESGERTGKVLYFDARTGEQIDIESQKRVFMGGKKEIKNMADRIRERLN